MRVLPAASTKLPPKLTVPPPEKVRAEVPTALLMIVWLAAVPAVARFVKVLLKPLSSSVAELPTLPRTMLVEFAQAEAAPMVSVPEAMLVAPE